jgi:hypothetical protein
MNNPLMKDSQMKDTHKCPKCKIEKPILSFNTDKSKKSGISSKCKECQKIYCAENKEKILKKRNEWLDSNKEHILNYSKNYRLKNNKKILEYAKKNKEEIKKRRKNYENNNKKIICLRRKESRKKYKEKSNVSQNKYSIKKRNENPAFSMACRIGGLIRKALHRNGYAKKSRTHEIIGCDFKSFANHIESQFIDGMSWENRSEWHIDHIIPVSSAKDEDEIILLNHYLNLQPLWASDNLAKSCKMPSLAIQKKIKLSIAKEKGLESTL